MIEELLIEILNLKTFCLTRILILKYLILVFQPLVKVMIKMVFYTQESEQKVINLLKCSKENIPEFRLIYLLQV